MLPVKTITSLKDPVKKVWSHINIQQLLASSALVICMWVNENNNSLYQYFTHFCSILTAVSLQILDSKAYLCHVYLCSLCLYCVSPFSVLCPMVAGPGAGRPRSPVVPLTETGQAGWYHAEELQQQDQPGGRSHHGCSNWFHLLWNEFDDRISHCLKMVICFILNLHLWFVLNFNIHIIYCT